ncbi:hypothetical protein AGMMS49992_06040 [Clostridia bacterium]|nr:hypothetical protein AGMMS49992_06040 [Clostridia bacterium]
MALICNQYMIHFIRFSDKEGGVILKTQRFRVSFYLVFIIIMLIVAFAASASGEPMAYTDALGRAVDLSNHDRVIAAPGSFAEVWVLAGGQLVGATRDAFEEGRIAIGPMDLGSLKDPNLETILALSPDLAILNAETPGQVRLDEPLRAAGVETCYFTVETFGDYLSMLETLTQATGCADLYESNGLAVQSRIAAAIERAAGHSPPSVLLLRAHSTGLDVLVSDSMAGAMLRDMGCVNIAEQSPSLLHQLSLESILMLNPDYIFITVMGSAENAMASIAALLTDNPAWASLSAVRNGRYIILPKELFHLKPNARWGEAYEILADILYPDSNYGTEGE